VSDAVLLYDADCGFCRWAVDKLLAWDRAGRLRPAALQSPQADRLLPGLDEETKMASWHLVIDGKVYSGGAAAAPLLRLLPGGRPVAPVVAAFPGMTDRAYRLVARNRDRFGRLAGARCEVDPTRRRTSTTADAENHAGAERR
jgi:predicted DCC family thiol-disulfide oxidoreductase YuxK